MDTAFVAVVNGDPLSACSSFLSADRSGSALLDEAGVAIFQANCSQTQTLKVGVDRRAS
jgi:hypothetical protein